jgi:hypothetical protein
MIQSYGSRLTCEQLRVMNQIPWGYWLTVTLAGALIAR